MYIHILGDTNWNLPPTRSNQLSFWESSIVPKVFHQQYSVPAGGRIGGHLCHMAEGETLWHIMCPADRGSCLEV